MRREQINDPGGQESHTVLLDVVTNLFIALIGNGVLTAHQATSLLDNVSDALAAPPKGTRAAGVQIIEHMRDAVLSATGGEARVKS